MSIIRDVITIGSSVTEFGFNIAHASAQFAFNVARLCLLSPAYLANMFIGDNSLSRLLYGVHNTIGAAEVLATVCIIFAQTLTSFSLNMADATFDMAGYQRHDTSPWLRSIQQLTPACYTKHVDAFLNTSRIVANFAEPLTHYDREALRRAVLSYALLQQHYRTPHKPLPRTEMPIVDYCRCMGYAALAYGELAMNFLEYLPQGTYNSNIINTLAPGLTTQHIIHKSTSDSVYKTNYILIRDDVHRQVVLSVRGSMNLTDVITNLTCEHASYHASADATAHDGMYRAARVLDNELRAWMHELVDDTGYDLMLCGHSLGAGVAALLAIMWESSFPNIKCVVISPPCILSLEAARAHKHLITSFIVGDDVVCRLGIGSARDLRDAVKYLLDMKMESGNTYADFVNHTLHAEHESLTSDQNHILQHMHDTIKSTIQVHEKLYPPGLLIHMVTTEQFTRMVQYHQLDPDEYTLRNDGVQVAYVCDQLAFDEIQVSGEMFTAHLPHSNLRILRSLFPLHLQDEV